MASSDQKPIAPSEMEDETTSGRSSVFSNHFVLYLDFLGVSAAAVTWEDARAAHLIDVLKTVAASRASFSMHGEALPDGSYKINATAETSTFSDNVVASYPIPETEVPFEVLMDMYLSLSTAMVSKIAIHAMNIGMLVRGGLTVGSLYHSNGVVFGEAMIDAYRLESRVATYPRIVVSSRIYDHVPPEKRLRRIVQDSDGIWHLNYLPKVFAAVRAPEYESWINSTLKMIDQNIEAFEKTESWNELAKWSWFKNEFVRTAGR
jgi:hypothetical protein